MSGLLHRIRLTPVRSVRWFFAAAIDLALALAPTGVSSGPVQRPRRSRWVTALTSSRGVAISALLVVAVGATLYVSRATSAEGGSGTYVTIVRHLGSFDKLVVGDQQRVTVRVEPGAQTEITVFTDDNLAPLVRTRLFDGRLVIDTERPITQSVASEMQIVTGALSSIVVSEHAVVEIFGLAGSSLIVDVSGSSRLIASGAVSHVDLRASASRVDFQALVAGEVTVEARDGAVIDVHASEAVTGEASGGSEVRVSGGPATLDIDISDGAMVCEGPITVVFSCRQ